MTTRQLRIQGKIRSVNYQLTTAYEWYNDLLEGKDRRKTRAVMNVIRKFEQRSNQLVDELGYDYR
jgi:hypothetical protein